MTTTLTLIKPDDWHCHFRDGEFLMRTVKDSAIRFHRAIAMPNLVPPVLNLNDALAYQKRILAISAEMAETDFQPLMTLYLTETTDVNTLRSAKNSGIVIGCKLYPAGATTHSAAGVKDITKIYHLLETMQEIDLPLLIHGEVVDEQVDIFDRETVFIEKILAPIHQQFPQLRVVLEHISTKAAVDFVSGASPNLAATITPQHLWFNRNILFAGGLRPHYYCLPVLKSAENQKALIQAAISGNPKFFLGTDSAPHLRSKKEAACGCAGIYSAHAAIELYAQLFDKYHALDKLEAFASIFGANFYQLPINQAKITLVKQSWQIPQELKFGDQVLVPFLAGEMLEWQLQTNIKTNPHE